MLKRFVGSFVLVVGSAAMACSTGPDETDSSTANATAQVEIVDQAYATQWVLAPASYHDPLVAFTTLDLKPDGTYALVDDSPGEVTQLANTAGVTPVRETGHWTVTKNVYHDWLWADVLHLRADDGSQKKFGVLAAQERGWGLFYSNDEAQRHATAITRRAADAMPAECDFASQNCGVGDVDESDGTAVALVACIPANSAATKGKCVAAFNRSCESDCTFALGSGCTDGCGAGSTCLQTSSVRRYCVVR